MGYGWYSFDMEELEGQEVAAGRAGIMLHGGGSVSGCRSLLARANAAAAVLPLDQG